MNKVPHKLNRRSVLRGAAVAAVASPALVGKAIAAGEVTWRVQAHWPKASRNVSTTLRQWHLDFRLDFPPLSLVG
jgi:transposase